jgi:hypothetical protein
MIIQRAVAGVEGDRDLFLVNVVIQNLISDQDIPGGGGGAGPVPVPCQYLMHSLLQAMTYLQYSYYFSSTFSSSYPSST